MSNLPKYYFDDIPADLMREIVNEMLAAKLEPSTADIEEADDWWNRNNSPQKWVHGKFAEAPLQQNWLAGAITINHGGQWMANYGTGLFPLISLRF